MSGLTTHALDLARGGPAAGMTVEIWARDDGADRLLRRLVTNRDGRTDTPLLRAAEMRAGRYRIVFGLGDYHRAQGVAEILFEEVPVDVAIRDPSEHYHVPLLLTRFGYSTYRGS